MTWNHRVIRRLHDTPDGTEEEYAIHEVFYNMNDGGKNSVTEDPIAPRADDLDGLRWVLERMLKAGPSSSGF